jgi:tripeptide aminopeptidase
MVKRDRIVNEFMELARIDSLSKNERQIADLLLHKLEEMGYVAREDDAGVEIGGNAGNVLCLVKGDENIPSVLLTAHMDTVAPGIGKKPVLENGIFKSEGSTVLGGDDAAGIVSILELLRVLKEDGIKHGDIRIVFTVGEECGLLGSKAIDYSKINAVYGIGLDGAGAVGNVTVKGPSQNTIDIEVTGRAAHAGVEPEKGISAIQMAAYAISMMKLGRIDGETTANIGIINGGLATNIICERVNLRAEARSRDEIKLDLQTKHMKECFEQAAFKFGGSIEFMARKEYPAFSIDEGDQLIAILKNAAENAGINLILKATGGGSDINIMNGKGIKCVDLSVGMSAVHSVEEKISVADMVRSAEFLVEIIKAMK